MKLSDILTKLKNRPLENPKAKSPLGPARPVRLAQRAARYAGLNLDTLIKKTQEATKGRALDVRLYVSKTRRSQDGTLYQFICETLPKFDQTGKIQPHTVSIVPVMPVDSKGVPRPTGGPLSDQGQLLRVACDCEDFIYRWAYALRRKGACAVKLDNDKPPLDTNPTLIPGVCKHVYRVLAYLKRNKL